MNCADAQGKNVSGRGGSKCKGPVAQNHAWKPVQLEQSDQQEGRAAMRSERQGVGKGEARQVPPAGALAAATPRDAGDDGV